MPKPFELPGLGNSNDRPRPAVGVDLRQLKLTPVEGFVLSRVDGMTSFGEICLVSGLGTEATIELLRRLHGLGLIVAPNAPTPSKPTAPASPDSQPTATPPAAAKGTAPTAKPAGLLERLDDGSPVEAGELVGAPDLPELTRERIVRVHRRLPSLAPHELLGVAPNAAAGVVKKAYFAASKELHPDRFYGKELGPFRRLVADIFKACSAASDAMTKR